MGAHPDGGQAAEFWSWQWLAQLFTVHWMLWLGVQAQPPLVQSFIRKVLPCV